MIDRNVRHREGEIDLVVLRDDALVFVEVKLRRPGPLGGAVEAVSATKQRRLRELAGAYSAEHPELPSDLWIDVIAIDLDARGRVGELQHLESAVEG